MKTKIRRRCACGRRFTIRRGEPDVYPCEICRAKAETQEERWQRWLYQQLEPYLGQETVKVNELITRLLGTPITKKSAA